MYYDHGKCMYYDHSDHSTGSCLACLMFDAMKDGGFGGRNPLGRQRGLGDRQAPQCLASQSFSSFPVPRLPPLFANPHRSPPWYRKVTYGCPLEYNIHLTNQVIGTWYGDECQLSDHQLGFVCNLQSTRRYTQRLYCIFSYMCIYREL